MFKISGHNPYYDDTFFVSQFIKGLKYEIRVPVASQIPETLDRAMMLAHVQQDLQAQKKPWAGRQLAGQRAEHVLVKGDVVKPTVKLGHGDLWKDRQLREYRRSNGLCFRCGDKYDPQHQCAKKAEIHALSLEDHQTELSDDVLELLELQDLANAQELSLSVHALSGSNVSDTIRIRALVDNQVMLVLVDSGSSHSFINSAFLSRINCQTSKIPEATVKVANGEMLVCDTLVPELTWLAQGHTFITDMRVLWLGHMMPYLVLIGSNDVVT